MSRARFLFLEDCRSTVEFTTLLLACATTRTVLLVVVIAVSVAFLLLLNVGIFPCFIDVQQLEHNINC
jgi:hypothetical protein